MDLKHSCKASVAPNLAAERCHGEVFWHIKWAWLDDSKCLMQQETGGLFITGGIYTTSSDLVPVSDFFWLSPHICIPEEENKSAQDKEVNVLQMTQTRTKS